MEFLDSLDIANRACDHCGVNSILSVDEDSKQNARIASVYGKLRSAELTRNVWRFSIKRTALRPIQDTTMILNPDLWDTDITYFQGAVVKDANSQFWISNTADNLGNDPASTAVWDQYFGPLTVSAYDSGTSYYAGELVYVAAGNPGAYVVFQSRINGNSSVPGTAEAWAATTTYNRDDVVSYSGSQWRSLIEVNLNITPADAPATWDQSVIYASGNQVTASDGFIYTSASNSNTGNDPTTDAVRWTNTTVAAAWSRVPTLYPSSTNWLPLYAAVTNIRFVSPVGLGPSASARNVFRLPAGYLKEAPQDPKAGSSSFLGAPSGLAYNDWVKDGNYIVTTMSSPIILRFVADIVDVREMDAMFCEGLGARIAHAVCEPLTQSVSKLQAIGASYKTFMSDARTANAIEEGPTEPPEDDYITCRA